MSTTEVERAAEFLARHAVLLLGLGVVALVGSLLAVVAAVRVVARFRDPLLRTFRWAIARLRNISGVDHFLTRTSLLIPSAYLGLHLTLGLLLVSAVTVFGTVAEEVIAGGEMAAFDVAFARALHNATSPGWERSFAVVSWLGSRPVITAATLVVAVVLFLRQQLVAWVVWILAQAGGGLLNLALKETFDRTRPEFADPMLAASSWSFPSGHAMGTFIFCGLGCYLLLRERRSWITAGIMVALALVWCVVMAFSRLYLGVHFASDVLGGLVAGAAWVAVCVSALEVIRRRGKTLNRV
jgi:undecaprenyl-diphosphatase